MRGKRNGWNASPAVTAVVWVFALALLVFVIVQFVI